MTATITRRLALTAGLAAGAASCAPKPQMTPYVSPNARQSDIFAHGVASGDPAADSVVIWTRVSIPDAPMSAPVLWEIAADENFSDMRGKGETVAAASRDWTVNAVAEGLKPGETYYYRFRAAGAVSPVGRTRTLPAGTLASARFAVISCSNYPFGYFNVYDLIARQDDIDAVLHLGDYFYEYGPDGYGGETGARLGRAHEPARETVTLADYRKRHAQYKSDPASQAMLAAHPLIPIWDDHETTNDSWKGGAQNHQPETEGDWHARKRAALQAYYEWMPVREPTRGPEAFFRTYSYGDLLTLAAIESRLLARSKQFEHADILPTLKTPDDIAHFKNNVLWDQTREMLGAAQLDYLDRAFRTSVGEGQPWRLVANQIIMAEVTAPDLNPHVSEKEIAALEEQWDQARAFVQLSALGLPLNFDAWDGYPAARERFYDMAKAADDDGMIVVTGDTHTWWANELFARDGKRMGVELGTHSVTSPSPFGGNFLGGRGDDYALLTTRANKGVRYLSGQNHGFIKLDITRDSAHAEFMAVDTIESRNYNAFRKAAFDIAKDENGAQIVKTNGLSLKQKVVY